MVKLVAQSVWVILAHSSTQSPEGSMTFQHRSLARWGYMQNVAVKCRTYCLFETTIAAGAPRLLENSSDHFSDSVWNLVLAGTTVDYCATNATVYLATTSLWQSYESSPWGVSCVTHSIGHQLILICTKWQDCFLITDTVTTLHAFMHLPFFPVSLLLLT